MTFVLEQFPTPVVVLREKDGKLQNKAHLADGVLFAGTEAKTLCGLLSILHVQPSTIEDLRTMGPKHVCQKCMSSVEGHARIKRLT